MRHATDVYIERKIADLEAAIQRVRDLHTPQNYAEKYGLPERGRIVCDFCDDLNHSYEGLNDDGVQDWPCPTIKALDGAKI